MLHAALWWRELISALQEGISGASVGEGSCRGSGHEWVIGHARPHHRLTEGCHGGLGLPVDRVSRAIGLRVVGPGLGVGDRGLAGEGLLEGSAEAGREAEGGGIPKASGHAH